MVQSVKLALNSTPQMATMVIFVAHLWDRKFIFGNFHDQYQKGTCLKYTFKRKKKFDIILVEDHPIALNGLTISYSR